MLPYLHRFVSLLLLFSLLADSARTAAISHQVQISYLPTTAFFEEQAFANQALESHYSLNQTHSAVLMGMTSDFRTMYEQAKQNGHPETVSENLAPKREEQRYRVDPFQQFSTEQRREMAEMWHCIRGVTPEAGHQAFSNVVPGYGNLFSNDDHPSFIQQFRHNTAQAFASAHMYVLSIHQNKSGELIEEWRSSTWDERESLYQLSLRITDVFLDAYAKALLIDEVADSEAILMAWCAAVIEHAAHNRNVRTATDWNEEVNGRRVMGMGTSDNPSDLDSLIAQIRDAYRSPEKLVKLIPMLVKFDLREPRITEILSLLMKHSDLNVQAISRYILLKTNSSLIPDQTAVLYFPGTNRLISVDQWIPFSWIDPFFTDPKANEIETPIQNVSFFANADIQTIVTLSENATVVRGVAGHYDSEDSLLRLPNGSVLKLDSLRYPLPKRDRWIRILRFTPPFRSDSTVLPALKNPYQVLSARVDIPSAVLPLVLPCVLTLDERLVLEMTYGINGPRIEDLSAIARHLKSIMGPMYVLPNISELRKQSLKKLQQFMIAVFPTSLWPAMDLNELVANALGSNVSATDIESQLSSLGLTEQDLRQAMVHRFNLLSPSYQVYFRKAWERSPCNALKSLAHGQHTKLHCTPSGLATLRAPLAWMETPIPETELIGGWKKKNLWLKKLPAGENRSLEWMWVPTLRRWIITTITGSDLQRPIYLKTVLDGNQPTIIYLGAHVTREQLREWGSSLFCARIYSQLTPIGALYLANETQNGITLEIDYKWAAHSEALIETTLSQDGIPNVFHILGEINAFSPLMAVRRNKEGNVIQYLYSNMRFPTDLVARLHEMFGPYWLIGYHRAANASATQLAGMRFAKTSNNPGSRLDQDVNAEVYIAASGQPVLYVQEKRSPDYLRCLQIRNVKGEVVRTVGTYIESVNDIQLQEAVAEADSIKGSVTITRVFIKDVINKPYRQITLNNQKIRIPSNIFPIERWRTIPEAELVFLPN